MKWNSGSRGGVIVTAAPVLALLASILLLLTVGVTTAWVQTGPPIASQAGNFCVRDGPLPNASCVSNDVSIYLLTPDISSPCYFAGQTATLSFTAELRSRATQRYDIGMFIALDGGEARSGDSCYHDVLNPIVIPGGDPLNETSGIGPFRDLEVNGDYCADMTSAETVTYHTDSMILTCLDNDGDNLVDPISTCTSWDNQADLNCVDISGAYPGTNSKCGCQYMDPQIRLGERDVAIVKTANSQVYEPGDVVVYQLSARNLTVVEDPNADWAVSGMVITDDLPRWLYPLQIDILAPNTGVCSWALDPNDDPDPGTPPDYGAIVTCQIDGVFGYLEGPDILLQVRIDGTPETRPPDLPDVIPNTACVAVAEFDSNPGNNCDGDTITTPVTLAYFEATRSGGTTRFEWTTSNEVANAGFNLYSGDDPASLTQIWRLRRLVRRRLHGPDRLLDVRSQRRHSERDRLPRRGGRRRRNAAARTVRRSDRSTANATEPTPIDWAGGLRGGRQLWTTAAATADSAAVAAKVSESAPVPPQATSEQDPFVAQYD